MSSVCSQDVRPRTMTSHTAFGAPAGWRAQAWGGMGMLVWFIFRCRSFFFFSRPPARAPAWSTHKLHPWGWAKFCLQPCGPCLAGEARGGPAMGGRHASKERRAERAASAAAKAFALDWCAQCQAPDEHAV